MAPDQDDSKGTPEDREGQAQGLGRGSNTAWSIIGTLFAGMIAWGAIGWVIDRLAGTRLFTPFGVLVGMAGALYLIVRRYGSG